MIYPPDTWRWYGVPGHLIVARHCRFRLATEVGPWLVSTVGMYDPPKEVREIMRDPDGWVRLGAGPRLYETMVFRAGLDRCATETCACGMPTHDGLELDMRGYQTASEAQAGHMEMCRRWAANAREDA